MYQHCLGVSSGVGTPSVPMRYRSTPLGPTLINSFSRSDVLRTGLFAKEHLELRRKDEILGYSLDSCESAELQRNFGFTFT